MYPPPSPAVKQRTISKIAAAKNLPFEGLFRETLVAGADGTGWAD